MKPARQTICRRLTPPLCGVRDPTQQRRQTSVHYCMARETRSKQGRIQIQLSTPRCFKSHCIMFSPRSCRLTQARVHLKRHARVCRSAAWIRAWSCRQGTSWLGVWFRTSQSRRRRLTATLPRRAPPIGTPVLEGWFGFGPLPCKKNYAEKRQL